MNKVYMSGVDYFTPPAGSQEAMFCKACSHSMTVERGVWITKGKFGYSLPKEQHRLVDVFSCEFSGSDWHRQIVSLQGEITRTPSKYIADIISSEIEEIRRNRLPTKTGFWL